MWRNLPPLSWRVKDSETFTLVRGGTFLWNVWMTFQDEGSMFVPNTGELVTLISSVKFQEIWILIKIQPDATVCRYLFTAKLLYMFRVSQHPSSGILKTLTAASGTGHNTGAATSLQRGLIRPLWREVAAPVLWPVPEVAVRVLSIPDDGCCDTRNM